MGSVGRLGDLVVGHLEPRVGGVQGAQRLDIDRSRVDRHVAGGRRELRLHLGADQPRGEVPCGGRLVVAAVGGDPQRVATDQRAGRAVRAGHRADTDVRRGRCRDDAARRRTAAPGRGLPTSRSSSSPAPTRRPASAGCPARWGSRRRTPRLRLATTSRSWVSSSTAGGPVEQHSGRRSRPPVVVVAVELALLGEPLLEVPATAAVGRRVEHEAVRGRSALLDDSPVLGDLGERQRWLCRGRGRHRGRSSCCSTGPGC